jgi:lipoprotein-anchoring transpeptidase ErfK/SrfK
MIELFASLVVDLSDQKLYAFDNNGQMVFSTLVSTGKPSTPTPTGEFYVGSKYANTDFVGNYGRINLDNVLCLNGPGIRPDTYCLHPKPNEHQPLGTPYSLGCIRMGHEAAKFVFQSTERGVPVYIRQ